MKKSSVIMAVAAASMHHTDAALAGSISQLNAYDRQVGSGGSAPSSYFHPTKRVQTKAVAKKKRKQAKASRKKNRN